MHVRMNRSTRIATQICSIHATWYTTPRPAKGILRPQTLAPPVETLGPSRRGSVIEAEKRIPQGIVTFKVGHGPIEPHAAALYDIRTLGRLQERYILLRHQQ